MKEITTTSNTALTDQNKDNLNIYQKRLIFLVKGLKLCKPIPYDLLIKLAERISINANTLSI